MGGRAMSQINVAKVFVTSAFGSVLLISLGLTIMMGMQAGGNLARSNICGCECVAGILPQKENFKERMKPLIIFNVLVTSYYYVAAIIVALNHIEVRRIPSEFIKYLVHQDGSYTTAFFWVHCVCRRQ